jgi:hypothetical protein
MTGDRAIHVVAFIDGTESAVEVPAAIWGVWTTPEPVSTANVWLDLPSFVISNFRGVPVGAWMVLGEIENSDSETSSRTGGFPPPSDRWAEAAARGHQQGEAEQHAPDREGSLTIPHSASRSSLAGCAARCPSSDSIASRSVERSGWRPIRAS